MAIGTKSTIGREFEKFVESPSRPGYAAIDVVDSGVNDKLQQLINSEVDNLREKILKATDLVQAYTWADFGTKNERITRIDNSAASVGIQIARQNFSYTLTVGSYRLDNITWSIV